MYFWLHCVSVAARGLSLAVVSGGYPLAAVHGLLQRTQFRSLVWKILYAIVQLSPCATAIEPMGTKSFYRVHLRVHLSLASE